MSFTKIRTAFLAHETSPVDYVAAFLERIDNLDCDVQAWAFVDKSEALRAAEESGGRYRSGKSLSLIDGMPVGIKDLLDVKGMPTRQGLSSEHVAPAIRDNVVVDALRSAGAVILGKTITTSLGFLHPGPTRNPFDYERTPGGSSSGSAAAVAAGMVPVAIGTQLFGSVIRPASYCGNWGFKPTFGAIDRDARQHSSQSTVGLHANSIHDLRIVAYEIARRTGGDPGHQSLKVDQRCYSGGRKPKAMLLLQTDAWSKLDQDSKVVFMAFVETIRKTGVAIITADDSSQVEALESLMRHALPALKIISSWEQKIRLKELYEVHNAELGDQLHPFLCAAEKITLAEYEDSLAVCVAARRLLRSVYNVGDALIMPSSVGPAPLIADALGKDFGSGDVGFNYVSSFLGAPAISIPALRAQGMPLGLQLIGQPQHDSHLMDIAEWVGLLKFIPA